MISSHCTFIPIQEKCICIRISSDHIGCPCIATISCSVCGTIFDNLRFRVILFHPVCKSINSATTGCNRWLLFKYNHLCIFFSVKSLHTLLSSHLTTCIIIISHRCISTSLGCQTVKINDRYSCFMSQIYCIICSFCINGSVNDSVNALSYKVINIRVHLGPISAWIHEYTFPSPRFNLFLCNLCKRCLKRLCHIPYNNTNGFLLICR